MWQREKSKVTSGFICLLFLGVNALADDSIVGKIAVVNGTVSLANGQALKPGSDVHNNDTINTGSDSSTKILFTDQSMIDLGANSSFKVSDYALNGGDNRTGTFSLLYGKLRSLVTKKVGPQGKVEYRSAGAVMGVRGTEFVVDQKTNTNAGTPGLIVVAGTVAVGSTSGGASYPVKAGEMIAASNAAFGAGGAPMVSKASMEQMTTAVQSAKAADQTFTSSVTIQGSSGGGSGSDNGSKNSTTESVGSIVGAAVEAQASASENSAVSRSTPEFLSQNGALLPPINLIPGDPVTITVKIQ